MPIVLKSGGLNLLEPSWPVQACNGIDLPFYYLKISHRIYFRFFWPLNVGPIGFPETSVRNCNYLLRNNPEKRSSSICFAVEVWKRVISACSDIHKKSQTCTVRAESRNYVCRNNWWRWLSSVWMCPMYVGTLHAACCMSPLWRLEHWRNSGISAKFLNSWWRLWSCILICGCSTNVYIYVPFTPQCVNILGNYRETSKQRITIFFFSEPQSVSGGIHVT